MEIPLQQRPELEQQLTLAAEELLTQARASKLSLVQPRRLEPLAVILSPDALHVVTMLDVSQRVATLRAGCQSLHGFAFLFIYDGWIALPGRLRSDALLLVCGTAWGFWRTEAHLYTHSGIGHTFGDATAVPEASEMYKGVFAD